MKGSDKDHLLYDYCRKNRHTQDTCFRRHGFPPPRGGVPPRGGCSLGRPSGRHASPCSAHLSDATVYIPPSNSDTDEFALPNAFKEDEVLAFCHLMQGLFTESSASYAHTGHSGAHSATSHPSTQWIIDSGATEHMTGSASGFISYTPLSDCDKMSITDGCLSCIVGKGSISCSSITMSSILHVLNFTRNLLFIYILCSSSPCPLSPMLE
ncbi:hypothetical protein KSP39_PZI023862 [Platanthera zijinensis]|uniref:Retrovirus-related Pol polyprotein from transposon TNT 1-94-like beta-barrel domain-containing protein n=1 Tax=Platanthera zijinensis TaxID=2320716 RepID=A0AAP0ASV3_9ASPA